MIDSDEARLRQGRKRRRNAASNEEAVPLEDIESLVDHLPKGAPFRNQNACTRCRLFSPVKCFRVCWRFLLHIGLLHFWAKKPCRLVKAFLLEVRFLRKRSSQKFLLFLTCGGALMMLKNIPSKFMSAKGGPTHIRYREINVVFSEGISSGAVVTPRMRSRDRTDDSLLPFYGLNITILAVNETRAIQYNDSKLFDMDQSKKMDQDEDLISFRYWNSEDLESLHFQCRPLPWKDEQYPNCNCFHEVDLSRNYDEILARGNSRYAPDVDNFLINSGFYRDVWVHYRPIERDNKMILKTSQYHFDFDFRTIFNAQRDAIVMEQLRSSSQIITAHGYCAASVFVEALPFEVEEYVIPGSGYKKPGDVRDEVDVEPQNKFSPLEKLEMALEMAESLATLHGHTAGPIVHDDVQFQQWLRTRPGSLKLGDFNRATILEWNDKEQKYCKFSNGAAYGNFRAPEEYKAGDLDEKIDVYSFGNIIYGLLTGLWVFYENEDDTIVGAKVMLGRKPFIDPRYRTRSQIERNLVDIMERCWEREPKDRVSIFEVVAFLRNIPRK